MDSACRIQQGNCDEIEKSARPFLLFFLALWLNICNNSDQTFGLDFQHLPRDLANINAWKTMFDPYIDTMLLQRRVFYGNTKLLTGYVWGKI